MAELDLRPQVQAYCPESWHSVSEYRLGARGGSVRCWADDLRPGAGAQPDREQTVGFAIPFVDGSDDTACFPGTISR